jgi:hypothetical protein
MTANYNRTAPGLCLQLMPVILGCPLCNSLKLPPLLLLLLLFVFHNCRLVSSPMHVTQLVMPGCTTPEHPQAPASPHLLPVASTAITTALRCCCLMPAS